MKKRDQIRAKNKLKHVKNYKYLTYAKVACIVMIVLFLVYVGAIANVSGEAMEELLSTNPIVITGFMICTANLYVWYVLRNFLKDMEQLRHIESIRINLVVLVIGQFILMNFISAILIILSLIKYFAWEHFSLKKAMKDIRKDGQLAVLIVTLVVFILFISLVFGIYFSIR